MRSIPAEDLVNPLEGPREPTYVYRVEDGDTLAKIFGLVKGMRPKVGGFVDMDHWRRKRGAIQEEHKQKQGIDWVNAQNGIDGQDETAPLPEGTVELEIGWEHLRGVQRGGTSFLGNWVGPGARSLWFTRPKNAFDLAAKIHDFGIEVNGLYRMDKELPPVYWSRRAKLDVILWFTQEYSTLRATKALTGSFYPYPQLFLKSDGFINPIDAMPPGWLWLPYKHLVRKPAKLSQKMTGEASQPMWPNYWKATPEDLPMAWRELFQDDEQEREAFRLAQLIDSDLGAEAARASDWSNPQRRRPCLAKYGLRPLSRLDLLDMINMVDTLSKGY